MHVSPIDKEHWVATGDQLGIRIDDTGRGPFNMMSTDIQFTFYGDKAGMRYHGFETHSDKDGDKIIWDMWDVAPGSNKGQGKIIGELAESPGDGSLCRCSPLVDLPFSGIFAPRRLTQEEKKNTSLTRTTNLVRRGVCAGHRPLHRNVERRQGVDQAGSD